MPPLSGKWRMLTMAGENQAAAGHGSQVDLEQAQGMWASFVRLTKWGIGISALTLILLAIFVV
jgi:hypothetical protein